MGRGEAPYKASPEELGECDMSRVVMVDQHWYQQLTDYLHATEQFRREVDLIAGTRHGLQLFTLEGKELLFVPKRT